MDEKMKDYYQILGVTTQASDKEIKSAYRGLAKKYHPDAIKDSPELADKMYEIQAAYEVLGNPEKRKEYDDQCRQQGNRETLERDGDGQDTPLNPFESFFGFQAGKGMETYRDKSNGTKKSGGPIDTEALFASFFGNVKK
ncbi:MAG: J domain-containing protein [Lachnospiraceae bacterium]